jgi:hypothetical protein
MTKTIGVTDDWGDISLATNVVVLRDEISPAKRSPPVRRRLRLRHLAPTPLRAGTMPRFL